MHHQHQTSAAAHTNDRPTWRYESSLGPGKVHGHYWAYVGSEATGVHILRVESPEDDGRWRWTISRGGRRERLIVFSRATVSTPEAAQGAAAQALDTLRSRSSR